MYRTAVSRPVCTAIGDGLLSPEHSILDYGCGRGLDVQLLSTRGYDIVGWDPHFAPDGPRRASDVVNLGYVLNVIEDAEERRVTLKAAFQLARKALIIAVRIDRTLQSDDALEDGCVTQADTFQKIYTQAELRDYVSQTLGASPHMAGFGIAYVFKCPQLEAAFLERRAYGAHAAVRMDLFEAFKTDERAKAYVVRFEVLGRHPMASEFEELDKLIDFYGSLDRIRKYAAITADLDRLQASGHSARADVLTFLASLRLRGLHYPSLATLSERVRADITSAFGSYGLAKDEATAFMFGLGDRDKIAQAISDCAFGKRLPEDFYIHESVESDLPPLLRLLVSAAKSIVGRVEYNVLKIRRSGRAVSFLNYEDFDTVGHPRLLSSVVCYLPKADYSLRDYSGSDNPPILHRKDALVGDEYPLKNVFRELTKAEDELGLLSAPTIGFQKQWLQCLSAHNVEVIGHRLQTRSIAHQTTDEAQNG